MPFRNRPLVPIAIIYICGIIFAKYFCTSFQEPFQYNSSPRYDFLRENIRRVIYYNMPYGDERNLLAGLFLGERYSISKELIDVLRNTNTMHILAISGLHVGFIGIMLVGVCRLLFIPRKISALLALFGVLVYVSMVGWQPPAFRSAVMFCVFAMGWIIDRPSNTINSLALAAIIILLVTPQALFEAGFQLSFVIVLCLLLAVPSIKGINPAPRCTSGGWIKGILWTSCVAWIGSLPLVAYYFKVISPISILANLVIVPGITIVIALGFTSILLGSIYIGISGVFNTANYFLTRVLIKFLGVISEVPHGYFYIQDFPIYLVFFSYLVIGFLFFSLSQKRQPVVK